MKIMRDALIDVGRDLLFIILTGAVFYSVDSILLTRRFILEPNFGLYVGLGLGFTYVTIKNGAESYSRF